MNLRTLKYDVSDGSVVKRTDIAWVKEKSES